MKPHNILYVDDEPQNLDAFCRAFFDADWVDEIYTATSPMDGLRLLEEKQVSCIVTDQRMPGMTGTEFLARVLPRHPDPVRLILTAYTDVKEILEAINRGHVYYFVTKPWEAEELKIVLRRALEHFETVQELKRKNRELAGALTGLEQAHREQVRQYEMVISDEKTGVRNYHYFRIRLGEEFERARRYAKDLSLVMVDIDGFQALTQTHGALVGDAALRDVAQVLVEGQRSIDVVARIGADEFAVILPETSRDAALATAERARARIAEHGFLGADGKPMNITVSCGMAVYPAAELTGKEDLIRRADQALAHAKRAGKNRVSDGA
jgi:diguanylate cyclase (GGDEF)-like protein